jgi:phospholipid N-methyltransferase
VGLSDRFAFLRAYVSDWRRVGAVTPTSASMGRALARAAGAPRCRAIAELGAGTGPVTAALLEQLPPDGRLWAFEIRPDFAQQLRQRFDDPRLTVVEGSAMEVARVAREADLPGFDAIVSAVPMALLGRDFTRELLAASAEAMHPGAAFVSIQYSPVYLAPFLRERFGSYRRAFHLRNLPPAFILTAPV